MNQLTMVLSNDSNECEVAAPEREKHSPNSEHKSESINADLAITEA